MKILHTADWHLGHTITGYDRYEEQRDMLNQIIAITNEHKPDLFLLCGDIYHTAQPATPIQAIFNQTIAQLHNDSPSMTMIIISGNHDSASKHEIFRLPWRLLNVHMIGTINKDKPISHIIEIPHKAFVIAIPFTHERNLQNGFVQNLINEIQSHNPNNLPVILASHTSISGANFTGHENSTEQTIGGIDTIDIKDFAHGYDYLALGHIHREQFIHTGRHNTRYSGSPLPISFDENYEHSVTLVSINCHGEQPKIQKLPIKNPLPLITLPTEGYAPWDEVKNLLKEFPSDNPCYIRLNVEIDNALIPQASQEAFIITKNKKARFCLLNPYNSKKNITAQSQLSIQQFQQLKPINVAQMYAKDTDTLFDDELKKLFEETLKQITLEDNKI